MVCVSRKCGECFLMWRSPDSSFQGYRTLLVDENCDFRTSFRRYLPSDSPWPQQKLSLSFFVRSPQLHLRFSHLFCDAALPHNPFESVSNERDDLEIRGGAEGMDVCVGSRTYHNISLEVVSSFISACDSPWMATAKWEIENFSLNLTFNSVTVS